MKIYDKSITAWQAGIILFILLFANKVLVLPSLLYEGAHFEAFFVPIILFALEFGIIGLFYFLKKKFPAQGLSEILKDHIGKWAQVLVSVLFMIFFLSKAVLLYNVAYTFFRNMIYRDSTNFIFLFCFLPIINHLAICGLRVLGRTAQLFFPAVEIIALFCMIVGFLGVKTTPLLFETPFSAILLTSLKHISAFGDAAFLIVIMDRIQVKKGEWKVIFLLPLAASVMVFAIVLTFVLTYTYTSFMHPYAIFDVMSYVREYGGLGRVDIISMILIIIFTYFHLAIYMKMFMISFHEVFAKLDHLYSVLTFDLLFLIMVLFVINNLENSVIFGQKILPFFAIIPFVILPIFTLVCAFLHKRRRE